jgi:uncharacterized protein YjiS (DUF1127 family)
MSVQYQSSSLLGRIQGWFKKQQTIREMNRLPDYVLKDIGVHRAEIPDVAADLLQAQARWSSVPAQQQADQLKATQRFSY